MRATLHVQPVKDVEIWETLRDGALTARHVVVMSGKVRSTVATGF